MALVVKNPPANAGDARDVGLILNPWCRQLTPVFLPGECHGQRSLAGYSPWGHRESDTTNTFFLSFFEGRDTELVLNVLNRRDCLASRRRCPVD